jgi:hypothetical protein
MRGDALASGGRSATFGPAKCTQEKWDAIWAGAIPAPKQVLIKNSARCRKCGDVITSRYRHDFVECKCGAIFVDGGLAYVRRGGILDMIEDLCEYGEYFSKEIIASAKKALTVDAKPAKKRKRK